MNVINSLEKISNKLEEIGFDKEPGSILYSGNETLSKGNFYFLGLNPGGNSNLSVSEDTVINQLKNVLPPSGTMAPPHCGVEPWGGVAPPQAISGGVEFSQNSPHSPPLWGGV